MSARPATFTLQCIAVGMLLYAVAVGTYVLWIDSLFPVVVTNDAPINAETAVPGGKITILHNVKKLRDCPGELHVSFVCDRPGDDDYRRHLLSKHDDLRPYAITRELLTYDLPADGPVGADCAIWREFVSVCAIRPILSRLQPARFRLIKPEPTTSD